MRIAGLPVWALVLVACVVAPFVLQLWVDASQRRAKERTRLLLRSFAEGCEGTDGSGGSQATDGDPTSDARASGTGRAASERSDPDGD